MLVHVNEKSKPDSHRLVTSTAYGLTRRRCMLTNTTIAVYIYWPIVSFMRCFVRDGDFMNFGSFILFCFSVSAFYVQFAQQMGYEPLESSRRGWIVVYTSTYINIQHPKVTNSVSLGVAIVMLDMSQVCNRNSAREQWTDLIKF